MAKGRLSGVIGSVFGGGSKKNKKTKSKPSKKEAYEAKRTVDSTDVLHQDEGLFGKVFVLSLVEFYEAIGGRQGRIAESLPVTCETVFEDQMAVGGSYAMVGDDQYIFKFAHLDDRQSLLKAAKIIEIIGTKLLGENFLKSGKFKALLTAVGMDDITDADGNLDIDKVDNAVDMARQLPPEEPATPDDPVWVRLNYAGRDENDRWAAVQASKKDDIQWVALEVEKKNNDLQWTTLEHEKKASGGMKWETLEHKKDKADLKWETVSHKKKESEFNWQALEVEKQAERRAMLMQDGLNRFRDRRQPESDRRMRRDVHLGQMDRRAHSERRKMSNRRTG